MDVTPTKQETSWCHSGGVSISTFFDAILYYTKCIPNDETPAIVGIKEKGISPITSSTIDRISSTFTS